MVSPGQAGALRCLVHSTWLCPCILRLLLAQENSAGTCSARGKPQAMLPAVPRLLGHKVPHCLSMLLGIPEFLMLPSGRQQHWCSWINSENGRIHKCQNRRVICLKCFSSFQWKGMIWKTFMLGCCLGEKVLNKYKRYFLLLLFIFFKCLYSLMESTVS